LSETVVDRRYYEAVQPKSLGERAMVAARDRIYDDFLRLAKPLPHETILDVGVSDVLNDAANLLERKYPHPNRIVGAGLGVATEFQAAFPEVGYVQLTANARLPFDDGHFDIAVSNAVIEHVGSLANQRFFVGELARVAKRVFLTAPNGLFPVEHHTAIPLLHFWRPSFRLACRALGKSEWLDEANLMLMRRHALAALAPAGRRAETGYTGLQLGPFSSNLYLSLGPVEA